MAYKLDQDSGPTQSWFSKQWSSFGEASTWIESVNIWKLSNVLGWYMSNYLALKTQLMVGLERKINMLYKYEWYVTAPTKTLLNGETKIDLEKIQKTTPKWMHAALMFTSGSTTFECTDLEKKAKALNKTVSTAAAFTESHGTHTMTVNLGDSTETMTLGSKTITAPAGQVQITGGLAVRLISGPSSVVANSVNVIISGPIVNIG